LIVKVLDFGLAKAIERTVTPEQREIAEEITSNLRLKLSGAERTCFRIAKLSFKIVPTGVAADQAMKLIFTNPKVSQV
jgi:hypothetical protein